MPQITGAGILARQLRPVLKEGCNNFEKVVKFAAQLAPFKAVLAALWCESDRPSRWDEQTAFTEGRKPQRSGRSASGAGNGIDITRWIDDRLASRVSTRLAA
jgi:hypothetical protein